MFPLQFVVASSVLRLLMVETKNVRFIIAAGLAQVSEFSFVLGSRARRLGLITREVCTAVAEVKCQSSIILLSDWTNSRDGRQTGYTSMTRIIESRNKNDQSNSSFL